MGGELDLNKSWQVGEGVSGRSPFAFKCLVQDRPGCCPLLSLYKCIRNNSGSFLGSIVSVRG